MTRKHIFVVFTTVLCCFLTIDARQSGIYADGLDQTTLHQAISTGDRREVEVEILELLGLPDRPRRHIHPSIR